VADDSHQIAVSARFRSEHAEAVLGVVESDPLNTTCDTSWVDDSSVDFIWALGSPVLSSRATPRMLRRWSTARSQPHWLNGAY
jgi:hypothetical protein